MLLPLVCVALAGLGNALSISSRQPVYRRQNMSTPLDSTGLPSTQQDSTGISSTSLDSTGGSSTAITGVATFVMFPHQTNTVCGPFSGTSIAASMPTTDREVPHQLDIQTTYANLGANGAFGAAAGSISPGFGPGGTCQGSIDMVRDPYSYVQTLNCSPTSIVQFAS